MTMMHRTKQIMRESQANASWPDLDERNRARLDPGLCLTGKLQLQDKFLAVPIASRRSNSKGWRPINHRQERSQEVKQKLLARAHVNELLKSLRTDQFVGTVNLVSHSIYINSPATRRIPGKTSASDATSVGSSLSSGSLSHWRNEEGKHSPMLWNSSLNCFLTRNFLPIYFLNHGNQVANRYSNATTLYR